MVPLRVKEHDKTSIVISILSMH